MKELKELIERIDDELAGAEKYAELAAEQKYLNDSLSAVYASHAYEELNHADELHTEAVILIKQAREEGHIPTDDMLRKWTDEHKQYLAKADKIRGLLR